MAHSFGELLHPLAELLHIEDVECFCGGVAISEIIGLAEAIPTDAVFTVDVGEFEVEVACLIEASVILYLERAGVARRRGNKEVNVFVPVVRIAANILYCVAGLLHFVGEDLFAQVAYVI